MAAMDEDMKTDLHGNHGNHSRYGHHSSLGTGMIGGTPFVKKTRSLSDGGRSQLSPSPFFLEATRRTSKDDADSSLTRDKSQESTFTTSAPAAIVAPATPRRPDFPMRGLSLQTSQNESLPTQTTPIHINIAPLSPHLDHSQIYASPTNIVPRRTRGLEYSRAATSLHHSTLAEQSSPDSSPTIGGRAMNIPGRSNGDSGREQHATSLWSMMGDQERMNVSTSVGSANPLLSDSSSSEDDDFMDEEMEDAIYNTPQAAKDNRQIGNIMPGSVNNVVPWMPGPSSAINSLQSFRARPRKHSKKRSRGLAGPGSRPPPLSKSPPNNVVKEMREGSNNHVRRESISWAANQLHISGSESEDRQMDSGEIVPKDGARGVVKRAVTRRGNLLPKTRGFARIRAALAEESAPVDSEIHREKEVLRQVRGSDMDLEPRIPLRPSPALDVPNLSTAQSSPHLATTQEFLDDIPEVDMMTDGGLASTFQQQAMKNSKGKNFWDTFSEASSVAGTRVTPPPSVFLPRESSSGISEDVSMDSPSLSSGLNNFGIFGLGPGSGPGTGGPGSESQKSDAPQRTPSGPISQGSSVPPTAAEITRRINNKRRREDDFDPNSFKRRAVSPGMNSVHNSPITQSPLQRDMAPWGSRPGSNHGGDKASATPSENGSAGGNGGGRPISGAKGRVGFQGMTDTNEGLMRMSIE
ncbi:hypothetical protein GGR54DRAFT_367618 [Hypoxylon sp. NC1633]|nr:hypothetical protein GGR54DRAFT_367618 [Hypoxylon sp. NC1633]